MKKAIKKNPDDWMEAVYRIVRQIPYGKVCTYGIIAESVGLRLTARMVGWAMNHAHRVVPAVPAHRVVNRNGLLTGKHHFATPTLMEELLRAEKISVRDNEIVNFKEYLWFPGEK